MEVVAFYRFTPLDGLETLRLRLRHSAAELGLKGTVLLAAEGINGVLCGNRRQLDAWLGALRRDGRFHGLPATYSSAAGSPVFDRLKVRVKPETVTFGQPNCDPAGRAGNRVDACAWNRLLEDPAVTVIDVRNRYETAIGGFPGSLAPGTAAFSDFPAFAQRTLDPAEHRQIALCCTGGIRCEKASAYLINQGFAAVHQLDGGILRYLAEVPAAENRWRGECFVFDQRLAVDWRSMQGCCQQSAAGEEPHKLRQCRELDR